MSKLCPMQNYTGMPNLVPASPDLVQRFCGFFAGRFKNVTTTVLKVFSVSYFLVYLFFPSKGSYVRAYTCAWHLLQLPYHLSAHPLTLKPESFLFFMSPHQSQIPPCLRHTSPTACMRFPPLPAPSTCSGFQSKASMYHLAVQADLAIISSLGGKFMLPA